MFKKLGPGILYAAAAIGVSHVVQSTRAGGDFGFQLLWAVLLANLLKYPFYKISPLYVNKTGKSLIKGFSDIGRTNLVILSIVSLISMFIVQSAVTVVSGGLFNQLIQTNMSIQVSSFIVITICYFILVFEKYNVLDNLIKIIVVTLSITTIVAVVSAILYSPTKVESSKIFDFTSSANIMFLIALMGWMPAPMDTPIWHSLWAQKDTKLSSLKDMLFDFNAGYWTTALLACAFLALGALMINGQGVVISPKATVFTKQLISLYTDNLGLWSSPIIIVATFTTMFSTSLTCMDAYTRVMDECFKEFGINKMSYKKWLTICYIGSNLIIFFALSNMKSLVDFATISCFLMGPYFALNYMIIAKKENIKISKTTRYLMYLGLTYLILFALYFLFLRF